MKIVQSLWSKPALRQGGYVTYRGHWPAPKFFWYSWVISTGWALRHYGQVELITDNEGARWLVDTLKLPFTSVRTDLDGMPVSGGLWAYGKILAYAQQREAFFHIDGDVYLKGRLPEEYEQADVVCQFLERGVDFPGFRAVYEGYQLALEKNMATLPACWKFMADKIAGNCGILGGRNLEAIGKYTRDVMSLVMDPVNAAGWEALKPYHNELSCIVEQQLLWCSLREQQVPLTPLFLPEDFVDTPTLQRKALYTNYNHAAVEGKNPVFGGHLGKLVEAEFPEQFEIISELSGRTYPNISRPAH